jgi:hypothetical protein
MNSSPVDRPRQRRAEDERPSLEAYASARIAQALR